MFQPAFPIKPLKRFSARWQVLLLIIATLSTPSTVFAFDSTDFPIRVFIDPYIKINSAFAALDGKILVPEKVYSAFQQGVLDWTRLMVALPKESTDKVYTLILKRRASSAQEIEAFNRFGFIRFVDKREDADLVIESVDRQDARGISADIYRGYVLGYHTLDRRYRIGRIVMSIKGEDLGLRTVLLHEIGHSLGFEHHEGQECNLMNAFDYTCTADSPPECAFNNTNARCIAIEDSQLRFIEEQLHASKGKGPKIAYLDWRQYEQQLNSQIQDEIVLLGEFQDKGSLTLKLLADGSLKSIDINHSFGSHEKDVQILERIKQIANFGKFPATHEKKEESLSYTYPSNQVSEKYLNKMRTVILAQIYPILPVNPIGKLHMKMDRSGQILQLEIAQSFGNAGFDGRILQRLKDLKAFAPFEDDEYQQRYATLSFEENQPLDESH